MPSHTSRRNFLKEMGMGGLGISILPSFTVEHRNDKITPKEKSNAWFRNLAINNSQKSFTNKPIDIKIGVQPVSSTRVHKTSYEGPCRTGCEGCLSPEAEKESSLRAQKRIEEEINKSINKKFARIFPTVRVEFSEGDRLEQKYYDQLGKHASEIDLFVANYRVPGIEEFKKPFAVINNGPTPLDTTAYMRHIGLEGYALYDYEDLDQLIRLLQVRKAVYNTRILNISNNPSRRPQGVYSSMGYEILKERFGIDSQVINYDETFECLERIRSDSDKQEESNRIAQALLSHAEKTNMNLSAVQKSVDFYLTVKGLMNQYNCNAFTVKCFELCNSQFPAKYQFTPCLTHSLLKDEGYPSFCEGDLNAGMAMILSEYLTGKSVYMGNPMFYKGENKISINHSVSGKKINGIDKPDIPYHIISFTEGLWGATLRYDFNRNNGEVVTLSRFDPSGTKMLLTKGGILSSENVDKIGCANFTFIKMNNEKELRDIQADFGHHLAMVVGDYTEQLKALCRMLNVEVVEYKND